MKENEDKMNARQVWKELIMFGMSLPGGYISSLRNQAKEMLEVKRLAVEFTSWFASLRSTFHFLILISFSFFIFMFLLWKLWDYNLRLESWKVKSWNPWTYSRDSSSNSILIFLAFFLFSHILFHRSFPCCQGFIFICWFLM